MKTTGKWYYYLLAAPLYLFLLLPMPVLYLLSDFFFVVVYHILGYRKQVVVTNLKRSFPQKDEATIRQITKAYYRYMIDLFLETFKVMTISSKELKKRCHYAAGAIDLCNQYFNQQRSVMMVMGHYGNWEWGGHVFCLLAQHKPYALYHPVKSAFFNWFSYHSRTRFGLGLINMHHALKTMVGLRHEVTATAFIADQTPSNSHDAYWTTFLNQETPVLRGTEMIAKKLNQVVLYASVQRLKRGYYEVHFEVITEQPQQTQEGEITERFTRLLEKDIQAQPEFWLWSHRRWKHAKPLNVVYGK